MNSNIKLSIKANRNINAIREKNVGTLSAVVGQMFHPIPQINVGRRDVFSRQAYAPNIEWWGMERG